MRALLLMFLLVLPKAVSAADFRPDETPPPRTQPSLAPVDGATVLVNPPSMAWRDDPRAASYSLELSPTADFGAATVQVTDIAYAFYNHRAPLAAGSWFWRYRVKNAAGEVSQPSAVRSFVVPPGASALPLPVAAARSSSLAGHPRIFTTPATLDEFRARRKAAGAIAWEQVRLQADEALRVEIKMPTLLPLPAVLPPHRRQVFWVQEGVASVPKDYGILDLVRDADRANLLSLAYLISGEQRYADAAKTWALYVANFRVDFQLKTVADRGQHDTVVYAYERGLKGVALVFDRLHDQLTPEEQRVLLAHISYHGEAAFHWIRDVMRLHVNYQDSHGQQCMHMLLTTALAVAGDLPAATDWLDYMVPQYANRIPWMSEDGGYFEGQAYAFKLSYILEALAALRSATGLDLFQKPEIKHAGDFFLYCQSLNYWWPHWGDTMGLWFPYGNVGDGFMSALLAAMTGQRELQWWSNHVPASAATPPFGYLAATGVVPRPPVTIPQARVFEPTGVVAAFDRHYDEATTRLFFRSSPWGGESHAHADQNSFVLHGGGEILAADTGYYTYYGDENYNRVSTQTIAHNSVLVGGKGQTNDIKGEGRITGFFNSPKFAFMGGDASKAYGEAMTLFRRDLFYVRPGLIFIADELKAPQPAEFTWILNTFVAPDIARQDHTFRVVARDEQLTVNHLFPENLRYESSNAKLTPRKTKEWTRFTEAFPEPWRIHAITEKTAETDIFTLLHQFPVGQGQDYPVTASTRDAHASAAKLKTETGAITVVMKRKSADRGSYEILGANTDARAVAVETGGRDEAIRWVAIEVAALTWNGNELFHASAPLSVASEPTSVAAAMLTTQASRPTRVVLTWAEKPTELVWARPGDLEHARPLPMEWQNGKLSFEVPSGEGAVLINPRDYLKQRPRELEVRLRAGQASQPVKFETAMADDGDWVAFATVTPRNPGIYEWRSADPGAEILVSDRWDPGRSRRGRGVVRALVGTETEIILRFRAGERVPAFSAELVQAMPLATINLLRNGDCEAGLPGFPPRGWTVQNGCTSETYGSAGEQGWPGWTQEDAATGRGALKFIRPLNYTVDWRVPYPVLARNQMVALAPPVRLLQAGRYVVSCETKGTATTAVLEIESAAGVVKTVALPPSDKWTAQRLELELPAGYTLVRVKFAEGGRDDQLLWADNFFLGPVGSP